MILSLFLLGIGLAGLQAQQRIKVKNLPFDTFEESSDEEVDFEQPTGADFGTGRIGETTDNASESSGNDGQDKEGEKSTGEGKCIGGKFVEVFVDDDDDGYYEDFIGLMCPEDVPDDHSHIYKTGLSKGEDRCFGMDDDFILAVFKDKDYDGYPASRTPIRYICDPTQNQIELGEIAYPRYLVNLLEEGCDSEKEDCHIIKEDCNDHQSRKTGVTPEGCNKCEEFKTFYPDRDIDGHGDASEPHEICVRERDILLKPEWLIANSSDCDDTRPLAYDNCDQPDCTELITFYRDYDRDGKGDENNTIQRCASLRRRPPGYTDKAEDCNDRDPRVFRKNACGDCGTNDGLADTDGDGIMDCADDCDNADDCPCDDVCSNAGQGVHTYPDGSQKVVFSTEGSDYPFFDQLAADVSAIYNQVAYQSDAVKTSMNLQVIFVDKKTCPNMKAPDLGNYSGLNGFGINFHDVAQKEFLQDGYTLGNAELAKVKNNRINLALAIPNPNGGAPIPRTVHELAHTLAHELGHTLGLPHPWEDSNLTNDSQVINNLMNSDENKNRALRPGRNGFSGNNNKLLPAQTQTINNQLSSENRDGGGCNNDDE